MTQYNVPAYVANRAIPWTLYGGVHISIMPWNLSWLLKKEMRTGYTDGTKQENQSKKNESWHCTGQKEERMH